MIYWKLSQADVAKLADASDLKSDGTHLPYRFEPGHRHHRGRHPAVHGRVPSSVVPLPNLEPVLFAQSANKKLAPLEKSRPFTMFGRE